MKEKINIKLFSILLLIFVFGLLVRLVFIDKPDGLWNDEYVSWMIASIPIGKEFWAEVFSQCHMPLYYFYLKFFMLFGNSDMFLRLTSVIAGILCIPAMYFVGREFKSERVGVFCAGVASVSSFLIYFSQEVRFYGLLFLFSSLLLLFTLKLLKEQKSSNIIWFIVFNLLIIFTHTIGFVFVGLNLILVGYYLKKFKNYKKNLLIILGTIVLFSLVGLPFLVSKMHAPAQFWGTFKLANLGFLLTDYFSPVLNSIVSTPDRFFGNMSFDFWFYIFIPLVIALVGIAHSIFIKSDERRLNIGLFLVSLGFIFALIIASLIGKLVFTSKYVVEVYPTFILLFCVGLLDIKNVWRRGLIFLYFFLNLIYLYSGPLSAPKLHRSEGHRIVAELLVESGLKQGDYILINYYPAKRFERYCDFSKYNVVSINKNNFTEYTGIQTKADFKSLDERVFERKFTKDIVSEMKSGQKLAVVILNDVSMMSPMQIEAVKERDNEFKKAPYLFMVFSYLKNEEMKYGVSKLQISRIQNKGSWTVLTFQKR